MANFNLADYLKETPKPAAPAEKTEDGAFEDLCRRVKDRFDLMLESRENSKAALEMQKRAIIGYEKEKQHFIRQTEDIISEMGAEATAFPSWYGSLGEAVYHENWGLAGLSEWFGGEYAQSSSAKIIGENIFFMKDGHMRLMPQKIGRERFAQLIKAFLLLNPEERMDREYHETYLLDGTRVTVFNEPMAKKGQACMIFRRYLIPQYSFEEQAKRGTIPNAAIPLFKEMVNLGFNVVFAGAVRTAKTTFLSTWQSYEDPSLEGVMVETDPEIPLHKLLPGAPLIQIIADGPKLSGISKNILRSDADYLIMAEARDGVALDTAVRLACKGTKRMKLTFHTRRAEAFPTEAAAEIARSFPGTDLALTSRMIASSFDYIFHFIQLKDKRQKRLNGIYQMNCSPEGEVSIEALCRFDPPSGRWFFRNIPGAAQKAWGLESDPAAYARMTEELRRLEKLSEKSGGVF